MNIRKFLLFALLQISAISMFGDDCACPKSNHQEAHRDIHDIVMSNFSTRIQNLENATSDLHYAYRDMLSCCSSDKTILFNSTVTTGGTVDSDATLSVTGAESTIQVFATTTNPAIIQLGSGGTMGISTATSGYTQANTSFNNLAINQNTGFEIDGNVILDNADLTLGHLGTLTIKGDLIVRGGDTGGSVNLSDATTVLVVEGAITFDGENTAGRDITHTAGSSITSQACDVVIKRYVEDLSLPALNVNDGNLCVYSTTGTVTFVGAVSVNTGDFKLEQIGGLVTITGGATLANGDMLVNNIAGLTATGALTATKGNIKIVDAGPVSLAAVQLEKCLIVTDSTTVSLTGTVDGPAADGPLSVCIHNNTGLVTVGGSVTAETIQISENDAGVIVNSTLESTLYDVVIYNNVNTSGAGVTIAATASPIIANRDIHISENEGTTAGAALLASLTATTGDIILKGNRATTTGTANHGLAINQNITFTSDKEVFISHNIGASTATAGAATTGAFVLTLPASIQNLWLIAVGTTTTSDIVLDVTNSAVKTHEIKEGGALISLS